MTRRNSRRQHVEKGLQQKQTHQPPPRNTQRQPDNPFGMSFVVATEVVKLPSRGKYYTEESTLFEISEIEIKHMTAKEEDLLLNEEYIRKGTVLDRLLESIIVNKDIKVQDLIADDKYALLTSARITSYGPQLILDTVCSACGSKIEFEFDLKKMLDAEPVQNIPDSVTETEDGLFEFSIDTKDLTVGIKIMTLAEVEYISQQAEKRKELGIKGSETVDFLNMVVEHVDGYSDRSVLSQLFEVLPLKDIRKIRKVYNLVSPTLNKKQTQECKNCGHSNEREVPFSLGWFWPDTAIS